MVEPRRGDLDGLCLELRLWRVPWLPVHVEDDLLSVRAVPDSAHGCVPIWNMKCSPTAAAAVTAAAAAAAAADAAAATAAATAAAAAAAATGASAAAAVDDASAAAATAAAATAAPAAAGLTCFLDLTTRHTSCITQLYKRCA